MPAQFHTLTCVRFEGIRFADDEMANGWYDGYWPLISLVIKTSQLNAIHADAFKGDAFQKLTFLEIEIKQGSVKFHDGALNSLSIMRIFEFNAIRIASMSSGLFGPANVTLSTIKFDRWPNEINLNEMFANEIYRQINFLYIMNLQMPQTKFRVLAAANFTSLRQVRSLYLINCGIEVIEGNAFRAIAHSLEMINLDLNRITVINVDMFRRVFESKRVTELLMRTNEWERTCTCRMLEVYVMQCPIDGMSVSCVQCWRNESSPFQPSSCGVHRTIDFTKWCIPADNKRLHLINIRLVVEHMGSIQIRTNFSSKVRVVFRNTVAMRSRCQERASNMEYKCLIVNKSVERFDLNDIGVLRDADLISIMAIPILYEFGARPMHLITLRRTIEGEEHWWIVMAMTSMIGGVIVGLTVAVCVSALNDHDKNMISDEPAIDEYYYDTSMANYEQHTEPNEYDECTDQKDYVEIYDTDYVQIH